MKWEQDLVTDIRFKDNRDDSDLPLVSVEWNSVTTDYGVNLIKEVFLNARDNCRSILEIGVNQYGFTQTFMENKLPGTVYVGIDIEDKSFLNNKEQNIHTIKNSSSNYEENISIINDLGITEFDFIFIDGWHSINQVLADWEYTNLLSSTGLVGFHDTNYHPGPNLFVNALDTSKWFVENNCPQTDWGVGFLTRI